MIIIELLGETRILRIIILIIIISAGTPLVSHSFNFNWKPKCIDPKIQYTYFGFQLRWKELLTRGVPARIIISIIISIVIRVSPKSSIK